MDENEYDLHSILGVLRRRLRLILVAVVGSLAIATIVIFALTPLYSATALVLFDPSTKNLLQPAPQLAATSGDNGRIDSEVELMRSDNILLKVIEQQDLLTDPEFGPAHSPRDQLLGIFLLDEWGQLTGEQALSQTLSNLRNAVSVRRRGQTYLIAVQAWSETADRAAELANTLAEAYIADQLASKVNAIILSQDVLEARLLEARKAIVQSEGAFDRFLDANLQGIADQTGRTDLGNMRDQIRALEAARSRTSGLLASIEADISQGDWGGVAESLESDTLEALEQQRRIVDQSLAAAPDDASASVLRASLVTIDDQLHQEATEQSARLRQSIAEDESEHHSLRQDLRRQVIESSLSADMLAQIYEFQQSAELARTQYQALLTRTYDLDTQAGLQIADSRIASPALPAQRPSFPNKPLTLVVAGMIGLGVGLALAFIYENLIGGFTGQEQVETVLKMRTASVIPSVQPKTGRLSLADMLVTNPLSEFAESARRLRVATNLILKPSEGHFGSVIMITSAAPDEGKSTVALALARTYALSGHRTMLIDCDLREPSLHKQLGVASPQGLLDLLGQEDSVPDVAAIIARDPLSKLTAIVGSRRSDSATDQLLASRKFAQLVGAARATYDVVILDTPPVGQVVDALYIAPQSDAILLVTRWAATAQRDVRAAVSAIEQASGSRATLLAVLNQQANTRSFYKRKYAKYHEATI